MHSNNVSVKTSFDKFFRREDVVLLYFLTYFNVYLLLRDRARVGEGQREREGDTESEAGSRLRAVSTEPDAGLEPTNCEIVT